MIQSYLIHQYVHLFSTNRIYASQISVNTPWKNNYFLLHYIFDRNDNPYIENYYYT